jgi:hypothetical protein
VLAHAPREREGLFLHLLDLLGVEVGHAVLHDVLDDRLARLLGGVERRLVGLVATALGGADDHGAAAAAVDLGIGHVDAVLAHALGELEERVVGVDRAGGLAVAGALGGAVVARRGVGRRRRGAERRDLRAGAVVTLAARGEGQGQGAEEDGGHRAPQPGSGSVAGPGSHAGHRDGGALAGT